MCFSTPVLRSTVVLRVVIGLAVVCMCVVCRVLLVGL